MESFYIEKSNNFQGMVKLDQVNITGTAKEIIEFYYRDDIEFYNNWKEHNEFLYTT